MAEQPRCISSLPRRDRRRIATSSPTDIRLHHRAIRRRKRRARHTHILLLSVCFFLLFQAQRNKDNQTSKKQQQQQKFPIKNKRITNIYSIFYRTWARSTMAVGLIRSTGLDTLAALFATEAR